MHSLDMQNYQYGKEALLPYLLFLWWCDQKKEWWTTSFSCERLCFLVFFSQYIRDLQRENEKRLGGKV